MVRGQQGEYTKEDITYYSFPDVFGTATSVSSMALKRRGVTRYFPSIEGKRLSYSVFYTERKAFGNQDFSP